jgi:hypothetical protein
MMVPALGREDDRVAFAADRQLSDTAHACVHVSPPFPMLTLEGRALEEQIHIVVRGNESIWSMAGRTFVTAIGAVSAEPCA